MPTLCAPPAGSASVRTTNQIPRILASQGTATERHARTESSHLSLPIFDFADQSKFRES